MHLMFASGASKPRNLRAFFLRKSAKISGWPLCRFEFRVFLAHFLERLVFGDAFARKGYGSFLKLTFRREFVDQTHVETLLGRHVLSARHHLQCLLNTGDAGQTLRSACTRKQADVHFRQTAFRARHGDAVMRAQRHFQTAAQRRAVDRSDNGLRRLLYFFLHVEQAGAFHLAAEFGDVGAGDERLALADQHDGFDGWIGLRLLKALEQPVAHSSRQRIHWRRVERDDGDLAIVRKISDRIDGRHVRFP